jgi:hypothetical protein
MVCAILSKIWVKSFAMLALFTARIIMLKRSKWAHDLKFCTQVIGLGLHQMEHYSWNSIKQHLVEKSWTYLLYLKHISMCDIKSSGDSVKELISIRFCLIGLKYSITNFPAD